MTNILLDKMVKIFSLFRVEGLADVANGVHRFSKEDVAVLKIAMMVSALDGDVRPEEFKAFDRIARLTRGYNKDQTDQLINDSIRSTGYIELQAKRLSPSELVKVFVNEAEKLLPRGFFRCDAVILRRAFVFWISIAMADGDYSPVERQAIKALANRFTAAMKAACDKIRSVRTLSPAFAIAYTSEIFHSDNEKAMLLPVDVFLSKAESILADFVKPDKVKGAVRDVKRLILEGC